MRISIDHRLKRLEARAGLKETAAPPVFRYIDNPEKPEEAEKGRKEAEEHRLKYPGSIIICHKIIRPPLRGS
jgi:hypothetical protein